MHKLLVAFLLSATPLMVAEPVFAHGTNLDMSRRKYGAILPDAYYDGLAHCETGQPLGQHYNTRSYTSSLGINKQTAARWSGRRNLNGLRPRQLVRIADRIAFSGWDNPRTGEHVWRVGPWGWGCVRRSPTLQAYICASHHPKVQRWKRGC